MLLKKLFSKLVSDVERIESATTSANEAEGWEFTVKGTTFLHMDVEDVTLYHRVAVVKMNNGATLRVRRGEWDRYRSLWLSFWTADQLRVSMEDQLRDLRVEVRSLKRELWHLNTFRSA